jgi:hypothetical protein
MTDPLKPNTLILVKLGSIAVHAEELLSPQAHAFDHVALRTLLESADVQEWLKQMADMAFVPVKR